MGIGKSQLEDQLSELAKTHKSENDSQQAEIDALQVSETSDPLVINTMIEVLDLATSDLSLIFRQGEPRTYFIADEAYEVIKISEIHSKAMATGDRDGTALQVSKYTGTQAPGASELHLNTNQAYVGSDETYIGFSLKSTINTVVDATLTTVTASLQLAVGDRIMWGVTGTISSTFIGLTTILKRL